MAKKPKNPTKNPTSRALAYDNGLVVDAEGYHHTQADSPGMYIARRAHLDETDKLAADMESKWGCDRLRLLVSPELREKFDRQRYLLNQATWHGELEILRREAARMCTAWQTLDKVAEEAGAEPLDEKTLELTMSDGSVVAICADYPRRLHPAGRRMQVYTLDEIRRLLEGYPELAKAKDTFPGAEVTAVRRRVQDPLLAFADSKAPIDDPIDDLWR